MTQKSNVYTRTGDSGTTSLVGGKRIKKNDVQLEAYGTIDELSSQLGVVAAADCSKTELCNNIARIQSTLFNIGGYLATEKPANENLQAWGLTKADIEWLEQEIDKTDTLNPKMNCFILPGGCLQAAQAHVARTVCRRAERRILDMSEQTELDHTVIRYINRLSDWLFVVARYINNTAGIPEILWQKHSDFIWIINSHFLTSQKFKKTLKSTYKTMYWTLELASKLEDAPWPATKEELIDYAMRSGAPLEVIENLQEMEDEGETYECIEDIWPDYPSDEDFFFNEEEY